MAALAALALACAVLSTAGPGDSRPRLLVLTDIGGDPDDIQSLRRLMLYANEFRIEGLVASASGTPGEVGRDVTRPDLIRLVLDDYAAVRDNLARHAPGYPRADELRRVVGSGSPLRGVSHLGVGRSTEGSQLIAAALRASPEPLYVAVWGGAHDLAQALHDVREASPPGTAGQVVSRLRAYAIADQDGGTGAWIRREFEDVRYVETGPPGMDRFAALFRGMYQNDSPGGGVPLPLVDDETAASNQEAWVEEHVRSGHGPLGAGYPLVVQNPPAPRHTRGVKEGDTPSWFFAFANGLGDPDQPTWGGWGGRFRPGQGGHFTDAEDDHPSGSADAAVRRKWTVARWRRAYQNDFRARMDWCVQPFARANHNPVAAVNADRSRRPLRLDVRPGERMVLDAGGSTDPDGDRLGFRWWVYREASSGDAAVALSGADGPRATASVAAEGAGTVHVVLEVLDGGTPPLSAYRRVLLQVGVPPRPPASRR
ncbi:MAG TPA: nucleoside hydrolase-like domain-containing protein [Vicinamibacteria bacterium]|nr:nucleoside hydrolase-like domain-containing protein [Vicinamibacteria bacterium]